ncbi:MAG: bifunctional 4-hydroxy-2-oxoglutarate aldolase/2-dehydro-3-deoxy-phosphogluconate aldolase [Xanthomonadales bacterium]|nr:bifunctional 4-hydroxy-2-oxoglutarate aldolase/2-dehydro-3-deoxy-phosphogluconate aldolase [Xanthomonadales bacterium]
MTIQEILSRSPVIPVVTISKLDDALPLADALLEGGVPIIEVTLRTPAAPDAIRRIAAERPEMTLGVGTIWSRHDLRIALDAGAVFGVSPGATADLLDAVTEAGLPFLPGAQTPSEVAERRDRGFEAVKFFPAGPAGGPAALGAMAAVFPDLKFCPTGGVSAGNAREYLAIPNVPVVGGSWLTPKVAVAQGDWKTVTRLARETQQLRTGD